MTRVCVPVFGDDLSAVNNQAVEAIDSGADLVELRADLLPKFVLSDILPDFSGLLDRTILTLRSRKEGGESDLSQTERNEWIDAAMSSAAAFVDLELDTDRDIIQENQAIKQKIIVSKHFFDDWTPDLIREILADCCSLGGIGKVAANVKNAYEGMRLLDILNDFEESNFALMGMGTGGEITRALATKTRSQLVYCAFDAEKKVAPGQLDLKSQLRISGENGFVVGLIGHPLSHSFSPSMQNTALKSLGLPGIYLPLDIPDEPDVGPFIRSCAKQGLRGLNVTIPHKGIAYSCVDKLDDEARRAGAVNTIVFEEDGSSVGYNTDIFGFSESLRKAGYEPRNRRALIIGAGGASKAAIISLWKLGAKITITNRTRERADDLVRAMRVFIRTVPMDRLADEPPFSLIVNATPVGMKGFEDHSLVPESALEGVEVVMDMIYNPPETPLLRTARERGIKTISGREMLLYQGAKAFELWCGVFPPLDVMRKELDEAVSK